MDFTRSLLETKRYKRINAYATHVLNSMYQRFHPMNEKQYNSLCNKLERTGERK